MSGHKWSCLPQVSLNPTEASDVLKRWAEYLCSPQVNQKSKAILVLLSLGCFQKVGEMLHRSAAHSQLFIYLDAFTIQSKLAQNAAFLALPLWFVLSKNVFFFSLIPMISRYRANSL